MTREEKHRIKMLRKLRRREVEPLRLLRAMRAYEKVKTAKPAVARQDKPPVQVL